MRSLRPLRALRNMLMMTGLALSLCSCSTQPTVTVTKTVVLAPPSSMLETCKPERVTEDTVRALAHGYVTNTYEVWKCNQRITSLKEWYEKQSEIYK